VATPEARGFREIDATPVTAWETDRPGAPKALVPDSAAGAPASAGGFSSQVMVRTELPKKIHRIACSVAE
jgi:hypothetical protein